MKNSTLLDQPDPPTVREVALVPVAEPSGLAQVIERLAANPSVDVAKLEKIIDLQERILAHEARAAFEAAFAAMQPNLPEIIEKGRILVKGTLRSTYARLEDIHAEIKPVLAAHGFALRHRTEWPAEKAGTIRIVGILSHRNGHSEESAFEAKSDASDYRTDIQSMGSTVSYGRRYTTLDLLNLTTRGADDDGQRAGAPPQPDGYDDWWTDMTATADNGTAALNAVWTHTKTEYKNFTVQHNKGAWEKMKVRAAQAPS